MSPYPATERWVASMGTEGERVNLDAARLGPSRDYRPEELGREFDNGYDANRYQRKEKVAVVTKCPACHKDVALVAETEEWEQREDGTWEHAGWGPATGVCCDNLIVEFPDGFEVYPLPPKKIGGELV
jgi:hypothetical protein